MMDHLSIGVADIKRAKLFYDAVFQAIDVACLAEMDILIAYGKEKIQFLAMLPFDGRGHSAGNGTHVAFRADTTDQVDAFYQAALMHGGSCEGLPGTRAYPHAEVYAAYVRDPFGNKLEILTNGFSG